MSVFSLKPRTLVPSLVLASCIAYMGNISADGAIPDGNNAEDKKSNTSKLSGLSGILMEEVVTRSRKKSNVENSQDVPIAMTAFSGDQLDALQVNNVTDLAYSMPNVYLKKNNTLATTANFSIRGLGVSSSIPSTDPTVGVFMDGMYYGVIMGVVMDTFDLEGMEVLRGPQGLLFGRNVTGGAVTLRTRRPSQDFDIRAKSSITDDNHQTYAFSTTGPLIDDVLSGKLSVYYSNDEGYFDNRATNNSNFGSSETFLYRGGLTWTPTEDLEFTLLLETGDVKADGTANKNLQDKSLGKFQVDLDEEGFTDVRWNQAILETNYNVAFGDGVITNITAYRELELSNFSDADNTNTAISDFRFNFEVGLDQNQISNELRYAGTFMEDALDLTVGVFYFEQEQDYFEGRDFEIGFLGLANEQTFGGLIDHKTWAVFTQGDLHFTDTVTMTLGLRYSFEEKEIDSARGVNGVDRCTRVPDIECAYDFSDDEDWSSVTPKIGLSWFFTDSAQIYASYTKGFRSGGYNLRHNTAGDPGPYDEEIQNAFEIGLKSKWWDDRLKFNLTGFLNTFDDLQRQIAVVVPGGVSQVIANPADATISGVELEVQALVTDNLVLNFSVGYLDGEYDDVRADLTGDGLVDSDDKSLALPLLTPWTWQVGANYDIPLQDGLMTVRASWNHRNTSYWNDSNTAGLRTADMVDAGISYTTANGQWTTTLFGKNLLDDEIATTNLPIGLSTIGPIDKGKIIGLELSYQL